VKVVIFVITAALFGCAQSSMVFDPVQNKPAQASTAATSGTLTVSINLPAHTTRGFSILLYRSGILVGGLPTGGAAVTDAGGLATVQLLTPDTNNCLVNPTTPFANGTYEIYFAIRGTAETQSSFVSSGGAACLANGFLQYSDQTTSFFTHRGTVTINGNTTYSIGTGNTAEGRTHKFILNVGNGAGFASRNYRCNLADTNATFATNMQPIAQFVDDATLDANGDGCTTGDGVATTLSGGLCSVSGTTKSFLPPGGSYKYFCVINSNSNGIFGDTGDKLATGTIIISGSNTTYLTSASFSNL